MDIAYDHTEGLGFHLMISPPKIWTVAETIYIPFRYLHSPENRLGVAAEAREHEEVDDWVDGRG